MSNLDKFFFRDILGLIGIDPDLDFRNRKERRKTKEKPNRIKYSKIPQSRK